jgi:hypothetical protein
MDDGDEATAIGEAVRRTLRSYDRGTRLDRRLFSAILPSTNARGGSVAAQGLHREVELSGLHQIRCAVAASPPHAPSASELMEEAEAALDFARSAGLSLASPSMLHDFAMPN